MSDETVEKPRGIAAFALKFPQTSEEQPFGPNVDVYKVAGKMFAILVPRREPPALSLKCDPVARRSNFADDFAAVNPGYHLNKTHWNTVTLDGTVPDDEFER